MTSVAIYDAPLPYTDSGIRYYAAIADLPWAVWLDSAGCGRYDILCAQPVASLATSGERTEITDAGGNRSSTEDPFDLVRGQLGEPAGPIADIPFAGGALGCWSYDLARRLGLLQKRPEKMAPDMAVGIYDWAVVLDHRQKTARLVSRQRHAVTEQRLPQILARLQAGHAAPPGGFQVHGGIEPSFTHVAYKAAFAKVQDYLQAGDCYQVNLAQCYAAQATGDAFQAYLALRRLSPAPYSAYLNLPQVQVLCSSPERFLSLREGFVETKPIKGTRPRVADKGRDAQIAQELLQSTKDRAENLMIVDLLRNDLGKSCIPGSVLTPKLFELESYAQVHHLVSTVIGHLASGEDALSLLRNCFPGGSVTGAPKRRAMQIIEELEPCCRGVYCGAIGYVGYDGNMDSNIAIRTLVYNTVFDNAGERHGAIRFWAGSGIVADSDVDAEYREIQDKAAAMLRLLREMGGTPAE